MPDTAHSPPAAGLTRTLSLVIMALMLGAVVYAAWIAISNWNQIGV